ncbi:hypothetical protein ACFU5O_27720 [Streptomyces sp. NPDC057445]|uniref:hypothetical protein n=1 Tax=Streptomyces sp. NPDC057445 TaxID=3346136 RepID=UPI00369E1EF7
MTTPSPIRPATTPRAFKLSPHATVGETEAELERRLVRLDSLGRGLRRARALDTPPPTGPRDLRGLDIAMSGAYEEQAYYFGQAAWPVWQAIRDVHQRATVALGDLNARAERTPQAAVQAARITTLAASLIARHAAEASSHLDNRIQRNTPGAEAMRVLTRVAEAHAEKAAGLEEAQKLDTPRLLLTHIHKLNRELQRAEPGRPATANAPELGDPDDPALDSALAIGAAVDLELAGASHLMEALTNLAEGARRAGHRLVLDVRLHGLIEAAQIRGFEMISRIARRRMDPGDEQGRRQGLAALIHHYAEQRLERMRGALGIGEQREFGHYEITPPDRYRNALDDETRFVMAELKAKYLRPNDRSDLQIRFLLAQRTVASDLGDEEWGVTADFPPKPFVAGMRTDNPVATRLELIAALRRRVENNPSHRDASFLHQAADRFAREVAGPTELTDEAREAEITTDQIRAVAKHLVEQGTVASPLALSNTPALSLTHGEAERALDVLQTLNVVGPPNGLKPRETLVTKIHQLPAQLKPLEERLPNLLQLHNGPAQQATPSGPATRLQDQPAAAPMINEEELPLSGLAAHTNEVLSPEPIPRTLSATPERGRRLPDALRERDMFPTAEDQARVVIPSLETAQADALFAEGTDQTARKQNGPRPHQPTVAWRGRTAATSSSLPRRDRTVERPHPGNITTSRGSAPESPKDTDLAQLLATSHERIQAASRRLTDGVNSRAVDGSAHAEPTIPPKANADEAQRNAQQAQQTTGVDRR